MGLEILADGGQAGRKRLHQQTEFQPIRATNDTGAKITAGEAWGVLVSSPQSIGLFDSASGATLTVVAIYDVESGAEGLFANRGLVTAKISRPVLSGDWVTGGGGIVQPLYGNGSVLLSAEIPATAIGWAVGPSDDTAGTCLIWLLGYTAGPFNVENTFEIYDDFLGSSAGIDTAGVITLENYAHLWARIGPANSNSLAGVVAIAGDGGGATQGQLYLPLSSALALATPVDPTRSFMLEYRLAQLSATAATRRIGLAGTIITNADPANGIFWRFTAAGNLTAVARSGGIETPLDTLVAMAAGTFHKARLHLIGGTTLRVWVDGVYIDQITTNIPAVPLGPTAGGGVATNGVGISLDYIRLRAERV